MPHDVKNFDHLIGDVKGLSEKQLKAHFGLYQGYVKKLNEIEEKLKTVDRAAANYSFGEFSELKRREAVAFNGAYLHELYFENLAGTSVPISNALKKDVERCFGSYEKWIEDLKASASSTPGWVLVTFNAKDKMLHNYILFEHHIGLPAFQQIILALDCWEHAFMIDYGTNKADYLKTFIENVNWKVVNQRFEQLHK